MAEETAHDLPIIDKLADDDAKNDSGAESAATTTSSSTTLATIKLADNKVPEMTGYWKKSSVIEVDCKTYHDLCWLSGNLVSMIPEVDVPTTHGSTVMCFESHLISGLGLPPSKFLVAIMNYLGCELVHFNPNAIIALRCFSLLCECWLGIASYASLSWYFYSLTRNRNAVYFGIRLSLHHHGI
jgi:hypothetical protein